jgi:uncharacterized damage-inducible protein DinB
MVPLVTQLHFARAEFMRCLEGLTPEDAVRRPLPVNCISWMVGHLAQQELRYWIIAAQGKNILPSLPELVGSGKPASTPPYAEMLAAWQNVTATADQFLTTLELERLTTHLIINGETAPESIGTMLLRNIYHYWFHLGEAHAVRQVLGHANLPQFVGSMSAAGYMPEGQPGYD